MSKNCAKCNENLKRSESISCESFCGQSFHQNCANINAEELKVFIQTISFGNATLEL